MALRPDGQLAHVMYYEGAHMLARDLGFMNAPALKGWAERHPEIWGTATASGCSPATGRWRSASRLMHRSW